MIIGVLTLLILSGMVAIIFFLSRPGDIPEIDGKEAITSGNVKHEKLLDRLKLAFNSKENFAISEEQLNHYLASKLKLTQGGKANTYIGIKGVWVDLKEDWIHFYVEREVQWGGKKNQEGEVSETKNQLHVSKLGFNIKTTELEDRSIKKEIIAGEGKIGGMPTPGLFGELAKAPLEKVAECFTEELELFKTLVQVRIYDGKMEVSSAKNTIIKPAPKNSSLENKK